MITESYLRETFESYFEKNESSLESSLDTKTPYKMFSENKVITSDLLLIISDIISCSYQKLILQNSSWIHIMNCLYLY